MSFPINSNFSHTRTHSELQLLNSSTHNSLTMDAPEDDLDIKLQKISADLITDFDKSLGPFLRKQNASGNSPVRPRVRTRETDRLISSVRPHPSRPITAQLESN